MTKQRIYCGPVLCVSVDDDFEDELRERLEGFESEVRVVPFPEHDRTSPITLIPNNAEYLNNLMLGDIGPGTDPGCYSTAGEYDWLDFIDALRHTINYLKGLGDKIQAMEVCAVVVVWNE